MPVLESCSSGNREPAQSIFIPQSMWAEMAVPAISLQHPNVAGTLSANIRMATPKMAADHEAASSAGTSSDWTMRGFDIFASTVAIILFAPLMLLLFLLIKATSSGPGLFRQQRVGLDGQLFPCLKFRTMVTDAQQQLERLLAESEEARLEWERDQKLRSDPRITAIGEFLRKTSLDELPQLFNILVGQMSIVGPRPIVEGEIARYGPRFTDYCSVRPGLTGLWQISGRNDVSYAKRVRLDSFYARRKSLALNVVICFRTVPAILSSRGCY
jgi:lipopolysaccharide/colanic/teichoic acid biosynthesis glycosyltransferase